MIPPADTTLSNWLSQLDAFQSSTLISLSLSFRPPLPCSFNSLSFPEVQVCSVTTDQALIKVYQKSLEGPVQKDGTI